MSTERTIRAFLAAATVTVVFIAAITIVGELYPPLKDWLKATFFHHWLGKGALAAMLFIATGTALSLSPQRETEIAGAIRILAWVSIASGLLILWFFMYEA